MTPNVLLLLPDQWRGMAQGWRGDTQVSTPHTDRLAAAGVAVQGGYANTPVCGPSRAGLLTGLLPHHHRVVVNDLALPDGVPTVGDRLAGHGYRTGWIGKWHLDGQPRDKWVPPERRRGFGYWAATNCSLEYFDAHYYTGDDPTPVPFIGYEPDVQTELATDFITAADERPFFLVVSYGPPHDPYPDVPDIYLDRYTRSELTPRGNVPISDPKEATKAARVLHQYYAGISAVDEQLGRLVEVLTATGRLDDTLIVLTSDHGDMLGSHGRWAKQVPHEEAISVPMVFSWPSGLPAGEVPDGMLGLVDLAPTILGLVGAEPLPNAYGRDLSAGLRGDGRLREEVLLMNQVSADNGYYQGVPDWRGIRTATHTYARRVDGTPWLLFDNDLDPLQLTNLLDESDAIVATVRKELDARLDALLAGTGDPLIPGLDMVSRLGLAESWNERERELNPTDARLLPS